MNDLLLKTLQNPDKDVQLEALVRDEKTFTSINNIDNNILEIFQTMKYNLKHINIFLDLFSKNLSLMDKFSGVPISIKMIFVQATGISLTFHEYDLSFNFK